VREEVRSAENRLISENVLLRRERAELVAALTTIADNIECQVGQWDAWRAARYARAAVQAVRPQADALLRELAALRTERAFARTVVVAARLACARSLFPGRGTLMAAIAAYEDETKEARGDADHHANHT
jgi:hypothetical protein